MTAGARILVRLGDRSPDAAKARTDDGAAAACGGTAPEISSPGLEAAFDAPPTGSSVVFS